MKTVFYYMFVILFPVILLAGAEFFLRFAQTYTNQSQAFVQSPNNQQYLQLNPDYIDNYFTGFNPAVGIYPFRKEKNSHTFRIVVLGGSTTAGFPYQFDRSFPSLLEQKLQRRNPATEVEVISLGITALNSFAIRDLGLKILDHNPDLAIIYGGHNEFYGSYGIASGIGGIPFANVRWIKNLSIALHQSHLYLALKDLLLPNGNEYEDKTLMAKALSNKTVAAESPERERAFQHFHANMIDVLKEYTSRNIPVILSTVSSNLRDQAPLGSHDQAIDLFKKTDKSATNSPEEAFKTLTEARDLDPVPFRAPSQINAIIRNLAERDRVWLVDSRTVFEEHFGSPTPGDSLFVDHLHFNPEGHEILAGAFATEALQIFSSREAFQSTSLHEMPKLPLDSLQLLKAEYRLMSLKNDAPFRSFHSSVERRRVKDSVRQVFANGSYLQQQALMYNNSTIGIEDLYRRQFGQKLAAGDTLNALSNLKSLLYYRQLHEQKSLESVFPLFYQSKNYNSYFKDVIYSVSNLHQNLYFFEALGALNLEQRKLPRAEVYLKLAKNRNPKSPSLLYNFARLYSLKGDTLEARKYYNQYRNAGAGAGAGNL